MTPSGSFPGALELGPLGVPKLKSQNDLVRLAAAGVFISALAFQSPVQAASRVDQVQHFIDCLGWMFTDPARHAIECGPTHEFFLTEKDTSAGQSDPPATAPPPLPESPPPPPPTDDCEVSTKAPLWVIGDAAILRVDCPIEGDEESFLLGASAEVLSI